MIKSTMNKLAAFPRLRIVLFLVLIVVVLFIISRLFSTRATPAPVPPSSINQSQITPNQPALNSQQYQVLAKQAQQNQLQQAAASGQSFFAGVFSGGEDVNNTGGQANTATGAGNTAPVTPESFYKQQLQKQAGANTASNNNNEFHIGRNFFNPSSTNTAQANSNQQTQALAQQMNQQLQSLSSDWKLPTGTLVAGAAPQTTAGTTPATTAGPVIIKAGTVLYAVLETALDSDQAGTPVMASIVTGQYQGAKLLGTFARENDALVLQFTSMSLPNMPNSISIQAFAIDGQTAQNALASSVDNHYLLRYGSVFAAGFLQGFGNAYNPNNYGNPCAGTSPGANCNVTINSGGTVPASSTAIYQGLGQVGTNLATAMQANFNTPPTVTLNQGTGMGILFMQDVRLQ